MIGDVYVAYDYPLLGVFWTTVLFFFWILWITLLFRVIVDIFTDDTLNGWAKAGWTLFVIVLPFLGVLIYVTARGKSMGRRQEQHAIAQRKAFDTYVRETAARPASEAEQLVKLADIHARGDISDEEFQKVKELILR
jgi:uncharacterized membrane protein